VSILQDVDDDAQSGDDGQGDQAADVAEVLLDGGHVFLSFIFAVSVRRAPGLSQNVDDDGDGGEDGQGDQISDVADVLFHCRCSSLLDVYFKFENLRSV
jgi:hypothetical protein